jgi:hypothetical protein
VREWAESLAATRAEGEALRARLGEPRPLEGLDAELLDTLRALGYVR